MMTAGRSQEMPMQCVMHNSLADYINLQFTKNQPRAGRRIRCLTSRSVWPA